EVPDPDQVSASGVLGRAGLGHQKQSRPGVKGPSGRYHSHAKRVRQTIERAGISKKSLLNRVLTSLYKRRHGNCNVLPATVTRIRPCPKPTTCPPSPNPTPWT